MAAASLTSIRRPPAPSSSIDWHRFMTEHGSKYLEFVSDFVDQHGEQRFSLMKPEGSVFRVAALEHTIYRDKAEEVNKWGKFYLPEIVNMQILGVVEGASCPADELVLMTCEDRKLYAYDGEELHVVAQNPAELNYRKIMYPSHETYYNGQAFEDMTVEDWERVKRRPVGQKLEEEHKKLVEKNKSEFLKNLQSQK